MKTLLILFLTMNQVFAQQNYGVTSGGVASQHFHVVAICSGEYGHKCSTPGAYHFARFLVTGPHKDDRPIYGPGKSLIGAARYWNPAQFYQLHPALRPYISQYDRDLLDDRYRLERYLIASKVNAFKHSDTFYVNMPVKEFAEKYER
jgi:hypothetical protein